MHKAQTTKRKWRLFIDQYGNRYAVRSRKELKQKLPGKVSIMYRDKADNTTVRCGYVIGQYWLTEFAPVETPITR